MCRWPIETIDFSVGLVPRAVTNRLLTMRSSSDTSARSAAISVPQRKLGASVVTRPAEALAVFPALPVATTLKLWLPTVRPDALQPQTPSLSVAAPRFVAPS